MNRVPCNIRIKEGMQLRNMKQSELAQKTNISKSMISEYVKGVYEPKQDNIAKISKALDVSEIWLMGISDNITRREIDTTNVFHFSNLLSTEIEKGRTNKIELASLCEVSVDEVDKWLSGLILPHINTIQILADYLHIEKSNLLGINALEQFKTISYKIPVFKSTFKSMDEEKPILYENIDKDMAITGEYFAILINDTYMEPRIGVNDIVILKKSNSAETGDIVAVEINDNIIIRKIRYLDDGIMLMPSNPIYDPIVYTSLDIKENNIEIIGKAVELRAKL